MGDQYMVKTCLSYTPEKAFAESIRSRSVIRCFENLDAARYRHTGEAGSKFAIVITN
jgi:hypothetical protein